LESLPDYEVIGKNENNGEAEKLKSAYYESLKLAKKKGIRKVAFPSIST